MVQILLGVGQAVVVAVVVLEVRLAVPVGVNGRRGHIRITRLDRVGNAVAVRVVVEVVGLAVLIHVRGRRALVVVGDRIAVGVLVGRHGPA
ncbi:MAG: hypothetical protein HY744_07040 [Deltaproteobacteria bacterium]|nr:hypothetical protein [Deltaproteobacteria bacterium]